jgi:hypothetical protein
VLTTSPDLKTGLAKITDKPRALSFDLDGVRLDSARLEGAQQRVAFDAVVGTIGSELAFDSQLLGAGPLGLELQFRRAVPFRVGTLVDVEIVGHRFGLATDVVFIGKVAQMIAPDRVAIKISQMDDNGLWQKLLLVAPRLEFELLVQMTSARPERR